MIKTKDENQMIKYSNWGKKRNNVNNFNPRKEKKPRKRKFMDVIKKYERKIQGNK